MRGYPDCPRCTHPWHALPCSELHTIDHDGQQIRVVCGCVSPADDDFWKDIA